MTGTRLLAFLGVVTLTDGIEGHVGMWWLLLRAFNALAWVYMLGVESGEQRVRLLG